MGRAPCCDKANVKRGPWSPEEDAKLKSYIEKHGTGGNWIALPSKVGLKRCGKSCRLRWLNYLRPNIKHGGFSEEEENIICSLYVSIGSRWSIIASQLPGRTDNDIKNYWNTRLKKKLLGKQLRKDCSQPVRGKTSGNTAVKQEIMLAEKGETTSHIPNFLNHRNTVSINEITPCWPKFPSNHLDDQALIRNLLFKLGDVEKQGARNAGGRGLYDKFPQINPDHSGIVVPASSSLSLTYDTADQFLHSRYSTDISSSLSNMIQGPSHCQDMAFGEDQLPLEPSGFFNGETNINITPWWSCIDSLVTCPPHHPSSDCYDSVINQDFEFSTALDQSYKTNSDS